MKNSETKAKIEKSFTKYDKEKKNEKDKNIAKNKNASKNKKQSDIMNAFYIFKISFKFSTSFRSKISASRSASKNSSKSKSKVYASRVKAKNIDLHETFSIIIKEDFAVNRYSLRSFWILNYNLDIHIANDIMQHRFVKERDCIDEFTIETEKKLLTIVSYESITVNVQIFIDIKIIKLLNVAYILDFTINIVFENILKEKELHFNIQHRHLYQNEKAIVFILKIENYYMIENNIKNIVNVFATKTRSITRFETVYKWHQLLAHADNEIIEHLA